MKRADKTLTAAIIEDWVNGMPMCELKTKHRRSEPQILRTVTRHWFYKPDDGDHTVICIESKL